MENRTEKYGERNLGLVVSSRTPIEQKLRNQRPAGLENRFWRNEVLDSTQTDNVPCSVLRKKEEVILKTNKL